jgi:acetyl-CoA carboxylase biotin carboxyl carrier protein
VSNNAKKTGPFDVKTVESLVALMTEHDLSEIYLRDGNQHVRLRRGVATSGMVPAAVPVAPALPAAATALASAPASKAETSPAPKKHLVEIKSETVGTFFAQAKPGEPPFAKLGDRVTPNKVVGLIEVMKTYNEVPANCSGVIVEVLAENGKYVDFNEVLFRVDPS